MAISFLSNPERGYFITKYFGKVTDDNVVAPYKAFFESDEWLPGLNELAGLSGADLQEITIIGIQGLADFPYVSE